MKGQATSTWVIVTKCDSFIDFPNYLNMKIYLEESLKFFLQLLRREERAPIANRDSLSHRGTSKAPLPWDWRLPWLRFVCGLWAQFSNPAEGFSRCRVSRDSRRSGVAVAGGEAELRVRKRSRAPLPRGRTFGPRRTARPGRGRRREAGELEAPFCLGGWGLHSELGEL